MKLVYFRGRVPNFGDELNTYVWPQLLPAGFLDEDESELFVGIGSIIGTQMPAAARKFVMGSGYAGYMGLPDLHDGSWDVRFVRGPRTAETFGLSPDLVIADSAILLRCLDELPPPAQGVDVAFMPHYESLDRADWAFVCRQAGMTLIDATAPTETVLCQIRGARLLVTEAMHGAIVADALRVPWVAAKPIFYGHHMKWHDWAGALGIDLRMHDLWPASLLELYIAKSGRGGRFGKSGRLNKSPLARLPNAVLARFAAQRLQTLASQEPQMSEPRAIETATERAKAALDAFLSERTAVS
jgi:hypothetical protein